MAAETETKYGAAEQAASGGLPQLDYSTWFNQIFWLVLVFAALYILLSLFILPRLREGISDREDRISDDLDQASNMQREAEEAEKAYNRELADARAKAMNVAETTKQSIDAEIAAEIEAADAKMDKQAEIAEANIRKIKTKALSNIESIAGETAAEVVSTLTGKAPTAAAVRAAMSN
jgi:F-type H+-transporting ATPase subunit b